MLADALQLDKRAVVYDLGSGFGRATVLFAMCVVLPHDLSRLKTCLPASAPRPFSNLPAVL